MEWSRANVHCALGKMLDTKALVDAGRVREDKPRAYRKADLVGYALYLHTRGGVFDDLNKEFDALRRLLENKPKAALRAMINARIRPGKPPARSDRDPTREVTLEFATPEKWTDGTLHCALGKLLDLSALDSSGLVRAAKRRVYTKHDLVGYALYLHTRGGIFDDLTKTFEELRDHLATRDLEQLTAMINERLAPTVRHTVVRRGTAEEEGIDVRVTKSLVKKF